MKRVTRYKFLKRQQARMRRYMALTLASVLLGVLALSTGSVLAEQPQGMAAVTTEMLNMREGMSSATPVLAVLPQGERVPVLDVQGAWYKVSYNGKTGYIFNGYAKLLASETGNTTPTNAPSPLDVMPQQPQNAAPQTPAASPVAMNTSNLTLLKLGMRGEEVSRLQTRLKELGYFHADVTGYYGEITRDAVFAFQKANNLVADGIAGIATQSVLYDGGSQPAVANPNTTPGGAAPVSASELTPFTYTGLPVINGTNSGGSHLLEWFGNFDQIFTREMTATIIDVRTGITYQLKRTGGTNHADCEPLTAEDTKLMKQAYGGVWSWDRRPVWVLIGGVYYAASINGMPHGYDKINDNGMSGQICIHTLSSRTHISNNVDPDHLKAMLEAYATPIPTRSNE